MKDTLLTSIRAGAREYGSVPFWSWNDKLDPAELRRQIAAMDEIGMHGFFMHARCGLTTEYLSEDWYECIKASVDEAKKRGMDAWAYDENGWPSGFAGGLLLKDPDNHVLYMKGSAEEKFPAGDDVLGVWCIENGTCRPVTAADAAETYLVIRQYADPSYVDSLRADITDKFLASTHAEYKKRLGDDFGKAMPGFFTDEPQYYRYASPYSKILPETFAARCGYDLAEALPAVFWDFDGAEKYRYDYWFTVHTLFTENFAKRIHDWCEENGCQLTGHGIEERSLLGQMMCCGGVMPFYRYQHVPGIDWLGRGLGAGVAAKQIGSVCAQMGKKKALTEIFACCGWDVSPRELKRIAEEQYAGGINLMCQHLYPYSERGQRKRDYPLHYSEHNPWFSHMGAFDRYFANLGRILAEGGEYAPVLVLHPMRAAYRLYKFGNISPEMRKLNDGFARLTASLYEQQIPFHYGDEGMLCDMSAVENGKIRIGLCTYDTLVIPEMETVSAETAEILKKFAAQGGRLLLWGAAPTMIDAKTADLSFLKSNITLAEIRAAASVVTEGDENARARLRQRIRLSEGRRIVYTANVTDGDAFGVKILLKNCRGAVILDIDTLEKKPAAGRILPDGTAEITLDLAASEAAVILEDETAQLQPAPARERKTAITLPDTFTLAAPLANVLTVDRLSVSTDGISFTEERPLERVRDNLLADRYAGKVYLRYAFHVTDVPGTVSAVWETPSVTRVTVNGTEIQAAGFLAPDPYFAKAEIAPLLHTGENHLILEMDYFQNPEVYEVLFGNVMESRRNCLCFDTEIEAVYLLGDFRVLTSGAFAEGEKSTLLYTGTFSLGAPRREICVHNVVTDGLPFYGGAVEAETPLRWQPGDPTVFRPAGRFAAVTVAVNGKDAGTVFFGDEIDLAPYLETGENTLRIRMVNSLRNAAGPFHRADPEPYGVSPETFSFEKQWKGAVCEGFCERYAFVKYGI